MFSIIISKKESFREGADLILKEAVSANLKARILYLEEIVLSHENVFYPSKEVLYFLVNDQTLSRFVDYFSFQPKTMLINNKFYQKDRSKFSIQNILFRSKISVPISLAVQDHSLIIQESSSIGFPLFLKSQKQADVVIEVNNKKELKKHLETQDNFADLYIEQSMISRYSAIRKFYFVNNESWDDHETVLSTKMNDLLKRISLHLGLDVFSADIFVGSDEADYSCIDVNPAPALFKCGTGRSALIKCVLDILKLDIKNQTLQKVYE